jgi:hypothetical protein
MTRQRAPDTSEVDAPAHYTQGDIECIDAIAAALGRDGFIAFLRGQVLKYTWRLGLKGAAITDARKAAWYQARLIAVLNVAPAPVAVATRFAVDYTKGQG